MKKHLAVMLAALLAGASVNTMMVSSVFAKEAAAEEKADKADKAADKKEAKAKKGAAKKDAKKKKPSKKKKDAE
jgi:hypothetical protein